MQAFAKAREPKQTFWIDAASHVDLYDKEQYVGPAIARLAEFYSSILASAEVVRRFWRLIGIEVPPPKDDHAGTWSDKVWARYHTYEDAMSRLGLTMTPGVGTPEYKAIAAEVEARAALNRLAFNRASAVSSKKQHWETLIICLSSIGVPNAHLCRYWEYTPTKRLVLSARDFSSADIDPTLLMSLAGAVASANDRLSDNTAENRVWIHSRSKRLTHR